MSTFLGGPHTLHDHYFSDAGWQEYVDTVWKVMRDFQTVLADHRVALKGFLNAGHFQHAYQVGIRHMAELKSLIRIVEELELHHPIKNLSSGACLL